MKNNRTKLSQRVRYAIIAGMAGAFLIPQTAFAAPTGGTVIGGDAQAAISSAGNETRIVPAGTNPNKVIEWRDYSLIKGEHVRYDYDPATDTVSKTNNYLNIVTGANTSNINGKIEGGNHVYIVNPNGVIFGKDAEVNVGHLHVSTQATSSLNTAADMANNVSPLDGSAGLSDVVNMGKIKATTVEVHGAHIRFLNAEDVKTGGGALAPVTVYTVSAASTVDEVDRGYAHIGYEGTTAPSNFTRGDTTSANPEYYKLVSNQTDLDNINTTNLAGNYMLAQDIDLGGAEHTPIGGNAYGAFSGKFDGNFFRVQNFKISNTANNINSAGLFGEVNGGRIENLGVAKATIHGKDDSSSRYAGGIAGHTTGNTEKSTVLKNVYVTNDIFVDGRQERYGGIVGATDHTIIDSAYSRAEIGTNGGAVQGGGIMGLSAEKTVIRNTYSAAINSTDRKGAVFVYTVDPDDETDILNSYAVANDFSATLTGLETGKAVNTYKIDDNGNATPVGITGTPGNGKVSARYSGWDINNDGAPGAKWRIYEGRTMPLLTAFMNGRVDSVGSIGANYSYRKFNQGDGSAVTGDANKDPISNNHTDITGLTYDSKVLKIVDASGNIGNTSNVTYDKTLDTTTNKIYTHEDTGTPLNTQSNVRNAGTKAMLWSDQDGPNLRNVNVTINKRSVTVENSNIVATRKYDGTRDVTDAYGYAIRNGGVSAGGITAEDIADGSVTITTSTDFRAEMDDKHVGKDKDVTLYGSLTFAGTNKDNYDITASDFNFGSAGRRVQKAANITKAPLILKVTTAQSNKIYDGTDKVTADEMKADQNVLLDETLRRTGETDVANIKTDGDTHNKDDVALDDIADPTYVDSSGNPAIHTGTHTIRYTGVKLKGSDAKNYDLYYQLPNATQSEVKNERIDLADNSIYRRQIKVDNFKVYNKNNHVGTDATKVYNGSTTYTLDTANYYLSSNQADTSDTTGVVERDRGYITFALTGNQGTFKKSDGTTDSKNVATADKIAYNVRAQQSGTDHLLSDYWIAPDRDTPLTNTTPFDATGAGKITSRVLTTRVEHNHIEKTYDAKQNHTDGNRNDITGAPLVTLGNLVNGESLDNVSTATYASPNVDWDSATNSPKAQTVTYTAKFTRPTDETSDNYTLDPTGATVTDSQTLAGSYTGTIKQRELNLKFAPATKVYDGEADNTTHKTVSELVDGLRGAVTNADGTTAASINSSAAMANVTSRYGRGNTDSTFTADANASNGTKHDVEYVGLSNVLGSNHNYKIADKQYGEGTISRRLIENTGFQVLRNGARADATKVYNGTNTFSLKGGEELVAKTAATGSNTGVVDKDKDNIYFTIANNSGYFLKAGTGTAESDRTSHVSEAARVGYNVKADTHDGTVSPLSNYYFGASDTNKRNLEAVNGTDPRDAVTAAGAITAASIKVRTHNISKVYDGLDTHTDGNRNAVTGDTVVSFTGWISDSDKRTNASTAVYEAKGSYAGKDVAYDTNGAVTTKNVTYTAKLTGDYANDYQIVDQDEQVISEASADGRTVALKNDKRITVENAGTIERRKLKITMDSVSKTYDGTAANKSATIVGITGTVGDDTVNNTILGDDGVTAGALQTEYRTRLTANPATATSTYGRGTTSFTANANASNGTTHDVQYTNMKAAFDSKFSTVKDNYSVDDTVYGKGTINRKEINGTTFKVSGDKASKVYDGTSAYTDLSGKTLTADTGEIISGDVIRFDIDRSEGKGAYFTKDDGTTKTSNVADAKKVTYHVTASGNAETLRNYTLNGKNLEEGGLTAAGDGEITRRVLKIDLAKKTEIDKEYDRTSAVEAQWQGFRTNADGPGNVKYVDSATDKDKLVEGDGAGFEIEQSYQKTGNELHDWDVNRENSPNGAVKTKNIRYKVTLTGAASDNYTLKENTADKVIELSATGTINPKNLSGAFKKVTKTYDGTTDVDPAAVGFDTGTNGVISGDTVTLGSHTESFRSANVNGDGTTETINGMPQKNWVNYSNLSLSGADAGNYTLKDGTTAKGLGEITPRELDSNTNIDFGRVERAEKTYDGTTTVKKRVNGVDSAESDDVRTYFSQAKVQVSPGKTDDLLPYLTVEGSYADKNVNGGAEQAVTYKLTYNGGNANFKLKEGAVLKSPTNAKGIITRRAVTAHATHTPFSKQYDATKDVQYGGSIITDAPADAQTRRNLLRLDGLTGNDDADYQVTRVEYADKNAGEKNRTAEYTLALVGVAADNYEVTNRDADGKFRTHNNTIEKRSVKVDFARASRTYNGSSKNDKITGTVSNDDAGVLNKDKAGLVQDDAANQIHNKLQNLGGLKSRYGKSSEDGFTPDPNVGEKDVQYAGLRAQMNRTLGADADNYIFDEEGYGKGRIDQREITSEQLKAGISFDAVKKEYDGNTNAISETGDLRDKMHAYAVDEHGNRLTDDDGNPIDIRGSITINKAQYNTKDVRDNGTQPRVTYHLKYDGKNYKLTDSESFEKQGNGKITPRDIGLLFRQSHIYKVYDGTAELTEDNKTAVKETEKKGRIGNDDVQITVSGSVYMHSSLGQSEKNASADTKEIAASGTNEKKLRVRYNLALEGADRDNYTIGGNETEGWRQADTVYGTGDIYRRTLKVVKVNPKDKEYDGISAVRELVTKDFSFDTGLSNETLELNDDALKEIRGEYLDNAGNPDPNVVIGADGEPQHKAIRYRGLNRAIFGMTDNYRLDTQESAVGYNSADDTLHFQATDKKGRIVPLEISHDTLRKGLSFTRAEKTYDGTKEVVHQSGELKNYMKHAYVFDNDGKLLKDDAGKEIDIRENLTIDPKRSHYDKENAGDTPQSVTYGVIYDGRNSNIKIKESNAFDVSGTGYDGNAIDGVISRRRLRAVLPDLSPTKTYDGTREVVGRALTKDEKDGGTLIRTADELDGYGKLSLYDTKDGADTVVKKDRDRVRLHLKAQFRDKNVNWKGEQQDGKTVNVAADKAVDYTYILSGAGAENYDFVDEHGQSIARVQTNSEGVTELRSEEQKIVGTGRIDPYEIVLKAEPKRIRSNETLPPREQYEGTPIGQNWKTGVVYDENGTRKEETLPGTIYYDISSSSPRWGDHPIKGYYRASEDPAYQPGGDNRYRLPDGTLTDSVARNYRFVQDSANAKALHIDFYEPDNDYYKELTQMSKMLPDEYAYENASLDRRSHFGRKPEAEVTYTPPSINMVKDGVDISKTGINITDESVFRLVNEVFG